MLARGKWVGLVSGSLILNRKNHHPGGDYHWMGGGLDPRFDTNTLTSNSPTFFWHFENGRHQKRYLHNWLFDRGWDATILSYHCLMQKFLIDESVMAIVQEVVQGVWCLPFQVTRSRILTKVPRVPPLVTVAEVAPPELASSSGFIQRTLKPNILLNAVWEGWKFASDFWKLGYRFTLKKRVPIACGRVRVILCRYPSVFPPGN